MKLWATKAMPNRERSALTYIAMALWVGLLAYNVSHVQQHLGQHGIHEWRMWALSAGPDILIGVGIWKLRYRASDLAAWLMATSGTTWLAWAALSTCETTPTGRVFAVMPIWVVGLVTASIEFRHRVDRVEAVESLDPVESVDPVESTSTPSVESTSTPSVESIELTSTQSIESPPVDRPESSESTGGRVMALVPRTEESIDSTESSARTEDVARLKAAIEAGQISFPPKNEPTRRVLKIGIPYVKAAIKQLENDGWTPRIEGQEVIEGI